MDRLRTRMEQGRKLRSMYRELGHDRTSAAKFFRITPRTLFNWEAGRTAIPFAVFKLLRLMLRSELPGKDWDGWCFNQGTLWSPEGHGYTPRDFGWLSLTIRQARLFSVLYRERCALQLELRAAKVEAAQAQAQAAAAEGHFGLVELALEGGLPVASGANDGAFSAWSRSAPRAARIATAAAPTSGTVLVTRPGGLTDETDSPGRGALVTPPERTTGGNPRAFWRCPVSPRPGRASVLTAEHVEVVKRLRAANPGVGMGSLRQLVAQACGLDEPPSQSALHRFMQRHAIRRGAYQDLPTEKAAQDLVCRALEIARGVVYDPAATADEHRGAFCQNLGNAFAHLVTLWAHEAGVRGVDTDLARAWLRDAGVAIAGRPAGSSGRGGAGSGLVQQRWCP